MKSNMIHNIKQLSSANRNIGYRKKGKQYLFTTKKIAPKKDRFKKQEADDRWMVKGIPLAMLTLPPNLLISEAEGTLIYNPKKSKFKNNQ